MNYKDGENGPSKSDRRSILTDEDIEDENTITRKEKSMRIFTEDTDHPFIQEITAFYISFKMSEEYLEALYNFIDKCPVRHFLSFIVKMMIELVNECDDCLVFLMNESIIRHLTESVMNGLPETKHCVTGMYELFNYAIKRKIFSEIPPFVLELPINISIYLESDTNVFLGGKNSDSSLIINSNNPFALLLISLNQASLKFLNEIIYNDLINDECVIRELYEKYMFFLKIPITDIKATALRGISLLSIKNQGASFNCLQNHAKELFALLSPHVDKVICSNTLDIFVNFSASDNAEPILYFLGLGLLTYLSPKNRDTDFIESLCVLSSNLLIGDERIAEFFYKSKVLRELGEIFPTSNFTEKSAIVGTFSALLHTSFGIDYFANNDILGLVLNVFDNLSNKQKDELSEGLLNLYQQLQTTYDASLLAEFYDDEFISAIEDAADEEGSGENVSKLLKILKNDTDESD